MFDTMLTTRCPNCKFTSMFISSMRNNGAYSSARTESAAAKGRNAERKHKCINGNCKDQKTGQLQHPHFKSYEPIIQARKARKEHDHKIGLRLGYRAKGGKFVLFTDDQLAAMKRFKEE